MLLHYIAALLLSLHPSIGRECSNGTFVNGVPVKRRTPGAGHRIEIGDTVFPFWREFPVVYIRGQR